MTAEGSGSISDSPVVGSDGRRHGEASLLVESPLRGVLYDEKNGSKMEQQQSGMYSTPVPDPLPRKILYTNEGATPIPITSYDTPTNSTRDRQTHPSKLVFLSDRKSVPTQMKTLQEQTIKRRREFLARIHELDLHTAKVMSLYAEERMNLDKATRDTFERSLIHPLMTSIEKLAMLRESSTSRLLDIPSLERRIGRLDVDMTRHIHVVMSDARVEKLESLEDDLQRNLKSEIRAEISTFNKIEAGIVQRFESAAGENNRNLHAEGAAHRSEIAQLQQRIEKAIPKGFERAEATFACIENLREQLRKERAVRQATDKAIHEEIVRRMDSLKRAMIAMASDGDSSR